MTWEALLKQLHKEIAAGKGIEDPTTTSKNPIKNEKGSPSCTREKRKQPKQAENASPSNESMTSTLAEETISTPENDNL